MTYFGITPPTFGNSIPLFSTRIKLSTPVPTTQQAIGAALLCTAIAQQAPPRLQIPGAIPLGVFPAPDGRNFRNERVQPAPALQRIRRPQQSLKALAAQQPAPQQQQPNYPTSAFAATAPEDAKPVNEDRDDEYQQPSFIPPNFQQHIQQQEQHLTESVSRAQQQQQNLDSLSIGGGRFAFAQQERQQPQPQQQQVVAQQQKQTAVRRPAFREASPAQYEAPQQQQPIRRAQQGDSQPQQRPRNSQEHQQQSQEREQKPVAQILRKYREENEDGSITWGFENDDGSYKEEFIGVDCVTR